MKQLSFCVVLITVILSSCIKDRLQPAAGPVKVSAQDTLMYYWDFNAGDSSQRGATIAINKGAIYQYYCSYIDFTGGSNLNLRGTSDSGQCLRLRNPSDSVIFYMPTTGFDSISIQFSEEASGSGPSQNAIYYTTDGVHYVATAIGNNTFAVGTVFSLNTFGIYSDPAVNDNPKFAIKIVPLNNNTGASGNDRIDNVSMVGVRK